MSEKIPSLSIENEIVNENESHLSNKKIGKLALENNSNLRNENDLLAEGYLNTYSFAKKLGTTSNTINKRKDSLGIDGTLCKGKNDRIICLLSPEDQERIAEKLPKEAPEGYSSIKDFAKRIKRSIAYLQSKMDELGIDGEEFKVDSGRPALFISQEDQERIIDVLPNEAPEGFSSVAEFAKKIGIDRNNVYTKMRELKIEGEKFKANGGQLSVFLSQEDQERIINASLNEAEEGYISVNDLAKKTGFVSSTIRTKMKELGVDGRKFRGKSYKGSIFLSSDDQKKIIDSLPKEAPEGYYTPYDFALKINRDRKTIFSKINELGLRNDRNIYKSGNKTTFYLDPGDQQKIIDSLSDDLPPNGYISINDFSTKTGIDSTTVRKYVKTLQIESDGAVFKDKPGPKAVFLSPRQQREIIELAENSSSSTSIPENATAYYLKMSNRRVEQGIRPDWLRNPDSGRNLEMDIFIDPPGIGIEYDGYFFHQDVERDIKKDQIALGHGYRVIHIREEGCPELPEGSICINRQDNRSDDDLSNSIKKCFQLLNIPEPDIDVARDKKDIMAFMRQRVLDKLDSARTFEELSVAS